MNELPRKSGRYHVARHIMLYVPPLGKPWFDIRVSYTRIEHQQQLVRKIYINVNQDFGEQLELAKCDAQQMYSEVRRKAEDYIKALTASLAIQKQEEHKQRDQQRAARTDAHRMRAREDVQRVWAVYGPEIEMRKPFFIYQWI